MTATDRRKAIAQHIATLGRRHNTWDVFSDFVEASAISISNAVDRTDRDAREARYLAIAKRYDREDLNLFPAMLGDVVLALEEGFDDVLGRVFHDLELHNKYHGQFFTPYSLARMMADMTLGNREEVERLMATRGYITALEPACGAGAMVIALAEALKELGINCQQSLHVTAVDVDAKCVHMAYVQLSLLGIPAVVVHGNSLSLEERGHWRTPAHVLGGWERRLRHVEQAPVAEVAPDIQIPSAPQGDLFDQAAA